MKLNVVFANVKGVWAIGRLWDDRKVRKFRVSAADGFEVSGIQVGRWGASFVRLPIAR